MEKSYSKELFYYRQLSRDIKIKKNYKIKPVKPYWKYY